MSECTCEDEELDEVEKEEAGAGGRLDTEDCEVPDYEDEGAEDDLVGDFDEDGGEEEGEPGIGTGGAFADFVLGAGGDEFGHNLVFVFVRERRRYRVAVPLGTLRVAFV